MDLGPRRESYFGTGKPKRRDSLGRVFVLTLLIMAGLYIIYRLYWQQDWLSPFAPTPTPTPLLGRVRVIHRAAAGEFALIPRDVTAGEFTKLTQRVPVEIDFLPEERDRWEKLLPGLSVTVAARRGGRDER